MILNDIKIIGNLVNDPEVRFTPKGTPVANFSLGINETYTVGDEKRQIHHVYGRAGLGSQCRKPN
jgi:single-strand DNA-binding protein